MENVSQKWRKRVLLRMREIIQEQIIQVAVRVDYLKNKASYFLVVNNIVEADDIFYFTEK